jgi:MFS family permease
VGLFFLAVGSAIIIPCLTALVSLYTPYENQGKSIGIFRSLGALGRVVGPIFASLVYYKYGSAYPYFIGSALLIIPILMVWFLPPVSKKATV